MKEKNRYKKRIFLANSKIESLAEEFKCTKRTIYNALNYSDINIGSNNKLLRTIRERALKEYGGVIVEDDDKRKL